MKWSAEIKSPKPLRFIIEQVQMHNVTERKETAGFYLYVYENERCTHDYLQDTLEMAMTQAFEDFSVPKDVWRKLEK